MKTSYYDEARVLIDTIIDKGLACQENLIRYRNDNFNKFAQELNSILNI